MDDTTKNFWQAFLDWQATPVEYKPPIQRLYYDDNGMPLFYVDQDLQVIILTWMAPVTS